MRGYFDRLHDDGRTVSGWAYSANCASNEDLLVRVLLRGAEIGRGNPSRVRGDLSHITEQPAGFEIKCEEDISALDVLAENVKIEISDSLGTSHLRVAASNSAALKDRMLSQWSATGTKKTDSLAAITIVEANKASMQEMVHRATQGDVSPLGLPVGLLSPDASAQLGRDGHLFLVGGTNNLLDLYRLEGSAASDVSTGWIHLFEERSRHLASRGIEYSQTVVPEKLTVLRYSAPVKVEGPTRILTDVENAMLGKPFYQSTFDVFEKWDSVTPPYRHNDTHFSTEGARVCFNALAAQIDPAAVTAMEHIDLTVRNFSGGDLADRFFGIPILAENCWPQPSSVSDLDEGLRLVDKYDPPIGHQGKRRIWTNSAAASGLRVLVFGNSFFEDGRNASTLSWWFARAFKEFRFEWSPSFDYDVIDSYKPDVVIGQTIERFLPKIPLQ